MSPFYEFDYNYMFYMIEGCNYLIYFVVIKLSAG